jgi:hypothetical protein
MSSEKIVLMRIQKRSIRFESDGMIITCKRINLNFRGDVII